MPQIWMTYVELGSLLECSPNEARDQAISVYADRKVSRDGLSRVKLNAAWMDLFMSHARVDDRISRQVHRRAGRRIVRRPLVAN